MAESFIVENRNHTIIGSVTRIMLLCGECSKSWEALGAGHWYECPHCKKGLPAWGLPQNIRFDIGKEPEVFAGLPERFHPTTLR